MYSLDGDLAVFKGVGRNKLVLEEFFIISYSIEIVIFGPIQVLSVIDPVFEY